jgi:hypothetical protein
VRVTDKNKKNNKGKYNFIYMVRFELSSSLVTMNTINNRIDINNS